MTPAVLTTVLALLAGQPGTAPAPAQPPPACDAASAAAPVVDFAELSLDSLLTEDLTVSTSGKQEMLLHEVPEALYVLTAEEIRRSGATSVAEVLRLVPGLDIIQLTPSHYEVSARNHEAVLANNLLLLIDGRPAYVNFFRINLWQGLPVVLEQIERIEVVLGPGSTLYGSNAVKGVVNIITRLPSEERLAGRALWGPQQSDPRYLPAGDSSLRWGNGYAGAAWWGHWGQWSASAATSYTRHPAWDKAIYLSEYE